MRRGQCVTCGKIKCKFVKKEVAGGSFLNSLVNKLPFEIHLSGHNFTGPGSKLNKRLNPDGTPKESSMPINRVDNAAYHHDLCYSKHDDTKTRNDICDKILLGELIGILNPSLRERIDKSIVGKLIRAKVNFCLGAPIKTKPKILNLQMTLQMNSINRSLENFREGELMLMVSMKFGLLI